MPATVAGPIAIAIGGVETLLSNVPYFQTWTGAGSAGAALANIFLGEAGYPIASVAIASDVLTITTREEHTITIGQQVTLQGAALGAQGLEIDGTYTVTSVTSNSFTVAINLPDLTITYPRGGFVIPSSQPFAVLAEDTDRGMLSSPVIANATPIFNGAVEILFENSTPAQYANDPANALTQARSEFGQLFAGIALTQGTLDYVVLSHLETVVSPTFIDAGRNADGTVRFERWQAMMRVAWGLTS